MKHVLSLALSMLCLIGQCGVVCHIFETNSTHYVRHFHTYSAKTEKLIPSPHYVTNGLTHWWDGQLNVGLGYHRDGDITFWKDLVGNKDLLLTSTNIFFKTRSLYLPMGYGFKQTSQSGVSGYGPTFRTSGICVCNKIPYEEAVTIEVCVRALYDYNDTQVAGIGGPSYRNFWNCILSDGCPLTWSQYTAPKGENPFLIAFYADHYLSRLYNTYSSGKHYWLVCGNGRDGSIRGIEYQNSTTLFRNVGSARNIQQTTICFMNDDTDNITASGVYGQPYAQSSIFRTHFHYEDAEHNVLEKSETATPNSTGGKIKLPNEQFGTQPSDEFTVGGTRDTYNHTREYNFFAGWIYAIRIYNRRLTEAEHTANATIDYDRFYGVD